VYWATGLEPRQPYVHFLDLTQTPDEVLTAVRASVSQHGKTGFLDPRSTLPTD
jgi:hypothetical protein